MLLSELRGIKWPHKQQTMSTCNHVGWLLSLTNPKEIGEIIVLERHPQRVLITLLAQWACTTPK
jgi:hypothetical protein